MPVPSSYNDVTTDASLRDFVGWVWYQKSFFVPKQWAKTKKTVLVRFGSVHYHAIVVSNELSLIVNKVWPEPFPLFHFFAVGQW